MQWSHSTKLLFEDSSLRLKWQIDGSVNLSLSTATTLIGNAEIAINNTITLYKIGFLNNFYPEIIITEKIGI